MANLLGQTWGFRVPCWRNLHRSPSVSKYSPQLPTPILPLRPPQRLHSYPLNSLQTHQYKYKRIGPHCKPNQSPKTLHSSSAVRSETMIRVRAMTTAVSGTPVRPGKTFAMSVLDHLMAAHHLRIVFYYRSEDMRKLKDSLTEALSYYPPVTGRLKRREEDGNWEVKCNDAGVRVLEAKLDVSLDEWLRSARAEELDLTYWEEMPEDPYIWSPFYVQVTSPSGCLASGYFLSFSLIYSWCFLDLDSGPWIGRFGKFDVHFRWLEMDGCYFLSRDFLLLLEVLPPPEFLAMGIPTNPMNIGAVFMN